MKNLKTFESFSTEPTNEGVIGKVRKFFKGYESKQAFEKAKAEFEKELKEVEAKVKENEDKYDFNKEKIEKEAKKNNYLGEIVERKGGAKRNKDITFVIYEKGMTEFKDTAKAAASSRR